MATDLQRLIVSLEARTKQFENALNKSVGISNKRASAIESRFARMNSKVTSSFSNTLRNSVSGLAAALGVREIINYADAWTEAGNKIRASATAAGVQTRSLDSLKEGANDARVAFGDYVDLYARLIRSASGVAKSENEIAAATNAVAKAFKAGGASASEQAAGILQLGQALGSGVLQGDELRSLRENAPVVAQAIATEFKTTISGLKQLGAEGKLTSDRVFRAIINAIPGIEKQFASTNQTIGDGFMVLRNNLTQYIGTTAETLGVTAAVNGVLQALAGNIGTVANAAAAAGVTLLATFGRGALLAGVAALANPFVALAAAIGTAAFAVTELWDDIVPLQGSFATLGDYAQVLWTLLSDGATQTKETIVWAFEGIVQGISGALEGVGTSFEQVWGIVKSGANTIIDTLVKMAETVGVAFTGLPSAIADGVISTMNTMVQLVQDGINKVIGAVNSAIEAMNSLGAGIPTVPPVDLGKIRNDYAGAGKGAADAFGDIWSRETRDYVGDAGSAISGAVGAATDAIVARANQVAEARRELEREANRAGGYAKPNTAGYGGGVSNPSDGDGKKKKKSDFEREVADILKKTEALKAETAAQATLNPLVKDYGFAVEKARASQELLTAAKEAGLEITPALTAQIEQLATAYATASADAEKLAEDQDKVREMAEEFSDFSKDLFGGFIQDIRNGVSATEALQNALSKVADKLLEIALNAIFDGGGLFGGISKLFMSKGGPVKLAGGGRVRGAGGPTSDKVPAMLSNGEHVTRTAMVKKHGALLDAINNDRVPRLAMGGIVGPAAAMASAGSRPSVSEQSITNVNFNPVINAQGADAAGLARVEGSLKDLAKSVPKMVDARIRDKQSRGTRA